MNKPIFMGITEKNIDVFIEILKSRLKEEKQITIMVGGNIQ